NWAIGFTDVRGRTEATVLGKIAEFERGRRLVVREISLEPGEGEALEGLSMVLTFADIRDGCLVTVEQLVPDAGPAYDRYRGEVVPGWGPASADPSDARGRGNSGALQGLHTREILGHFGVADGRQVEGP